MPIEFELHQPTAGDPMITDTLVTFEFLQPREPGSTAPDPTHWEIQTLKLKAWDVGPSGPFILEQVESPVYFTCDDPDFVRQECDEVLIPYVFPWGGVQGGSDGSRGTPEEVEACVEDNLSECVSIDTVPLAFDDAYVQVRACDGVSCSAWSEPTAVPEASFLLLLVTGCALLSVFKPTAPSV